MSEPTDIRNKQADATEAAVGAIGSVVPSVIKTSDAFKDAMTPEALAAVVGFLEQIGLEQNVALAVIGTHLGTFIGGCHDLHLSVEEMVDSLMHLHLRGSLPWDQMLRNANTDDNRDHLEASKDIAHAALWVLEGQITGPSDTASSMRKYLTLLVTMVHEGSAKIEAQYRADD